MDQDLEQNQIEPEVENYQTSDDNFSEDNRPEEPWKKHHSHAKFWIFLALAVFLLFISGAHLYENIIGPLEYDTPDWLNSGLSEEEETAQTIAKLKETDTDQDGLTDYQELYQYYTSMFLQDTDSDGLTDYEETTMGEDPLCPRGESCSLLKLITPRTKLSDIVQDVALDPDLTLQSAAASEFRKFLEESGVPKEDLDILTDEDLLNIFRALEAENYLAEEDLSASSTPEQVRAFLLSQPDADSAQINSLSDAELMQIADSLLNQ